MSPSEPYFITRGRRFVPLGQMVPTVIDRRLDYRSLELSVADFCPSCKGTKGWSQQDYVKPAIEGAAYTRERSVLRALETFSFDLPEVEGPMCRSPSRDADIRADLQRYDDWDETIEYTVVRLKPVSC